MGLKRWMTSGSSSSTSERRSIFFRDLGLELEGRVTIEGEYAKLKKLEDELHALKLKNFKE
jgi:hypothetical protein